MKKEVIILFFICLTFLLSLIFIGANDELTVEANFVDFGEDVMSIQIPDYIYLGTIDKDNPFSIEKNIRINNTGNLDVRVTPQLTYDSPEVFNYTYFRKQKSTSINDSSLIAFHKIGEYSIKIDRDDYETFYISLNLTNFRGTLPSDNLNLSTTIKFVVMAA